MKLLETLPYSQNSLSEGLRDLEEFEETQMQEILYAPSPMMEGTRVASRS